MIWFGGRPGTKMALPVTKGHFTKRNFTVFFVNLTLYDIIDPFICPEILPFCSEIFPSFLCGILSHHSSATLLLVLAMLPVFQFLEFLVFHLSFFLHFHLCRPFSSSSLMPPHYLLFLHTASLFLQLWLSCSSYSLPQNFLHNIFSL